MRKKQILHGASSWPTSYGFHSSFCATRSFFTLKGRELWRLSEKNHEIQCMITGSNGETVIASKKKLICIARDGNIMWEDTSSPSYDSLIILGENCFVGVEQTGRLLSCRNIITGNILWSKEIKTWYMVDLGITADNGIIVGHIKNTSKEIAKFSPSGELLWSYPINDAYTFPPLILEDTIVFNENSNFKAINSNGEFLWKIIDKEFVFDENTPYSASSGYITTPLMKLSRNQFLVGVNSNEPEKLLVFDTDKYTTKTFTIQQYFEKRMPISVCASRKKGAVLVASSTEKKGYNEWANTLLAISANEKVLWKRNVPTKPAKILSDKRGNILVISSPSIEYWKKYKDAYNLVQDRYIKGYNAKGKEIFHWQAPEPIIDLAIGLKGEIIVASLNHIVSIT